MQPLSFTQEYVLCAINPKGKPPDRVNLDATTFHACVFAGGLAELLDRGYLTRQVIGKKDKIASGAPWDGGLPHLAPLHAAIASSKKPRTAAKFAERHLLTDTKLPKLLFTAFGESLVAAGCAEETIKPGMFGDKIRYVPMPNAVTRVIEKVRAEILEDGTPTDETICLVALLDKSNLIRDYFSKVERGTLKDRLKQARATEEYASVGGLVASVDSMVEWTYAMMMGFMVVAAAS
jgi:hypothetical protein